MVAARRPIAERAGRRRVVLDDKQPGDPRRAAAAIVEVAMAEDPPLRLVLGADAVARIEGKLEQVAADIAAWRELSRSTDIQD